MSKHSLLLLTLASFYLSADSPEVKEAVESVTYSIHSKSSSWIVSYITQITIEKKATPHAITLSQTIDAQGLKLFGYIPFSYNADGSHVSYTKNKQTKEISVSIDYGNRGSLITEFFMDRNGTEKEKREKLNLLKALFRVKKYEASAKEN